MLENEVLTCINKAFLNQGLEFVTFAKSFVLIRTKFFNAVREHIEETCIYIRNDLCLCMHSLRSY